MRNRQRGAARWKARTGTMGEADRTGVYRCIPVYTGVYRCEGAEQPGSTEGRLRSVVSKGVGVAPMLWRKLWPTFDRTTP